MPNSLSAAESDLAAMLTAALIAWLAPALIPAATPEAMASPTLFAAPEAPVAEESTEVVTRLFSAETTSGVPEDIPEVILSTIPVLIRVADAVSPNAD